MDSIFNSLSFPLALLLLLIGIVLSLRRGWNGRNPPGPKGLPILGVVREHPKTEFWKKYAEWGAQYGNLGLISFQIMGRRRVIINSAAVAEDLLTRRSAVYSDRPFPPMSGELMRRERSLFYCSYNDRFKTYRKLFHQGFNQSAIQNYWELLQSEARIMVANVHRAPDMMPEHLRRNAGAVTMKIAYGYTITGDNDPFVAMAEGPIRLASIASAPGRWLVDSIPALKYIPSWFPGAGFKRQAKIWADKLYNESLEPHNWVKQQMAAGTAIPSFTSRLFEAAGSEGITPEYDDIVLWTAGAIYAAGADTIVAGVKAFYFLMMMHPDVQKRAQAEVDQVIAKEHRLPTLHDRPHMPYVDAVLQEVLRWATPAPIGLPHCTATSDVYEGFYIPAKTTVIPNIWAMTHDASVYPDPGVFNPDRFVKPGPPGGVQRDPRQLVFGFGRRMCPGQHVGEASVFIQMATILAALDISKALNECGQPIEPEISFTTALVSHIKPFKFSIKPRATDGIALILQDIAAQGN